MYPGSFADANASVVAGVRKGTHVGVGVIIDAGVGVGVHLLMPIYNMMSMICMHGRKT